ncbi:pentatricopeptide repeat-containing protein At3g42630-like [Vicia villosa]|uniref:pentatricopeptide repeat-containing protein At3g42630-like n=1 Tax=Vicia villosa TaxID=3911 RepID=UPI00273AAAD9|nr:pentatricopeptide repeat-containing protein At3g42630-like [Vicia villosa]
METVSLTSHNILLLKHSSSSSSSSPQQHHHRHNLIRHRNKPKSFQNPTTKKPFFHQPNSLLSHNHNKPSSLPSLMLYYAENALFHQSQTTWEQLLNSSFNPSFNFISKLFKSYTKNQNFDQITNILHSLNSKNSTLLPQFYSLAISCFGSAGNLKLMEETTIEMVSKGFLMDSKTGNEFLLCYAVYGSLNEMENAYGRFKRSRFLIEENVIRAMAYRYIKKRKFYELGEFVRDVGLGRRNVGNLLWNLLLLSYAANFKMKNLQREFVRMVGLGFRPDVTTFNIRALAFSRMSLFWDLHLSIEHMRSEEVVPDLVSYGCVVDGYLDRKLGRNLEFVLNKMDVDDRPRLSTDPFVFEVLGKGDFHLFSEAFLEYKREEQKWSYRVLIEKYVKKHYRRDQIFWNY